MNKRQQLLYVGMDIHKDTHTAVATDCFGESLLELQISNSQKDFKVLVESIEKVSTKQGLTPVFGLEDSYGYGERLAKHLFSRGLPVRMVSPVLVDRERRYATHPEKSDSLDAFGAAKVLIQKIDTLPKYTLTKEDQLSKEMKELVLDREFLVKEQTRLKNQLHRLLHKAYNSSYKEKFKNPFAVRALQYWSKHPVPQKESCSLLQKRQIKRKVKRLQDIQKEVKEIEGELSSLTQQTGQHLETMNGCGVVLASSVLTEIRNIERFSSPHALAKYAGLSPRERSSGKTFRHVKSKSGNRRLNKAMHRIALSQIGKNGNEHAKTYFQRKVSEGKSKGQALCCLKRRLIDIVFVMLKHKQSYRYPQEKLT